MIPGILPDGSIDVQQFNFATSNPTTIGSLSGGAGAGKAQFLPLEIVTNVGPQTAPFLVVEGTGSRFNTMTLTIRDAAARVIETIGFKLVLITSDAVSGAAGAGDATEDVRFAYGAMQITMFNPVTKLQQSQGSSSIVTNQPNFDVPSVTSLSVSKPSTLHAAALKTHVVTAQATTAIPTTIRLNVGKPHQGTTGLTARVTSPQGVPTGNVTFSSGKIELGQVAVGADGRATLSVPTALLGKARPFAIYSGGPDSAFQPATTVTGEAVLQKSLQKWLGRPMSQDEWVLTSMWLQEGFTPAKMTSIYKSFANKSS